MNRYRFDQGYQKESFSPYSNEEIPVENYHRLFSSYEQAITGIDQAIGALTQIKKEITRENFSNFGMETDHSFGKFDFLSTDLEPSGVIQIAPEILTIVVKNCTRLGKNIGNLWNAPTRAEVDAAYKLPSRIPLSARRKNLGTLWEKRMVKFNPEFKKKLKKGKTFPVRKPTMPVILMDPFTPETPFESPRNPETKPERKRHGQVSNSRKQPSHRAHKKN